MSTETRDGKRRPIAFLCLTLGAILVPPACTQRTEVNLGAQAPVTGTFVTPDAEAPEAASGLTQYCPSDECPARYTTCPLSTFRCEVNLLTDPNNCGACGVVCPARDYERSASFACVDGACVMQCLYGYANCDGVLDNGCESILGTNEHCAACGDECDPDRPCNEGDNGFECGCPPGKIFCGEAGCIDPESDDENCGACGNACDPGVIENNAYQGCLGGVCKTKCVDPQRWGNCDGIASNGCETPLGSDENCMVCGNACGDGQQCQWIYKFPIPPFLACACPAGQSFCESGSYGGRPMGDCHDFSSDENACGGCGVRCSSQQNCEFGVCRLSCLDGTADCNGSDVDGCEVNTNSDPSNCGGCGIECDGVAGQACVGGRCVVEPCDDVDAGGGTTR